MRLFRCCYGPLLALGLDPGCAQTYDLVIREGRVVDGTGNPAFHADVAVTKGRIAAVGHLPQAGAREINARNLVVAPGFVDIHTHADDVADHPQAENFVRMGVTTIVAGNCGESALDLERFFHELETQGTSVNVATLVGHSTLREKAMNGSFNRPPTGAELVLMKDLLERAMRQGAAGLSTGLIYPPGAFAKTEEIIELARVVARHHGLYATHMRDESTAILTALEEVVRIAREAGLRAEVSHLKLGGEKAWGQADTVLAFLEQARATGLDLTWDQYAYTASSTGLSQLIPDAAFEGGPTHFLARLADPAARTTIAEAMKQRIAQRGRSDYAYAVIASYPHDPSLNGRNVVEAARTLRGSDSLDAQVDTILEIQKNGGADGVFHGMDEGDLRRFMSHPFTAIACDSGIREFGKGVPHPRGYGNNARVLARYVRELKTLRLEEAVRKMTSLPATTFRFANRGLLREGNWADLVVFDPEKVQDNATFADPHHYATGFAWVFVNGVAVVDQDRHTGAKPGRPLRQAR